jgi:hypothetical protein
MSKKNKVDQFAYEVKVVINSDDDFKLNIPHTFNVTGPTKEALVSKLMTRLIEAKFERGGRNAQCWIDIRDAAIADIKAGLLGFEHGGNQTIKVELIQEP